MKDLAKRRRYHLALLLAVAAAGAAGLAYLWPRHQDGPAAAQQCTAPDLCRTTFAGRSFGHVVRVPFPFPLVPTADARVFHYHPGHPPELVPPTVRLEFARLPGPLPGPLTIVEGTVARIDPDDRPRLSGNLGVVVLTSCRLAPPAEP